ncbi:hypothetical protein [Gimesia maris]|uniref:Uncharacterized protein n=1 Tax=Gimesia maris TaxID=122 RepID=A0ABX5YIR0_9PLAN|nr:hypothetical protein [Gimesia maris]EDL56390.1 hypothetical protein PM8797T_16947 [Gimesia maris DSM 8797]QEG15548.1 hypothetical protein GmarT_13890 [Gimesia maris]QGQ31153.1 hypothetical protein F1729_22345 [Gimesia maris]
MSGSEKKKIKIALKIGGGPSPGYLWNVLLLDGALSDSDRFLEKVQYQHFEQQFKLMASCSEPLRCPGLDIDQIEDFHELKDTGGVLRSNSFRVFFGIDKSDKKNHSIVVLGVCVKKTNRQTPKPVKLKIQGRWRKYKNGDYKEV